MGKKNNQSGKEKARIEKDAYGMEEYCERHSISRTAFYREVWAERLRIFKCGRRTLVAKEDAQQWINSLR